jgi:hypothetical protein
MANQSKTTTEKLSKILDSLALGGTYREIAARAGTSVSHASNIAKEFPLWLWASGHDPLKDDQRTL